MEILLSRLNNEHHDENPTFHSNITIVVLIITIIQISLNNIYIPFYFYTKLYLNTMSYSGQALNTNTVNLHHGNYIDGQDKPTKEPIKRAHQKDQEQVFIRRKYSGRVSRDFSLHFFHEANHPVKSLLVSFVAKGTKIDHRVDKKTLENLDIVAYFASGGLQYIVQC